MQFRSDLIDCFTNFIYSLIFAMNRNLSDNLYPRKKILGSNLRNEITGLCFLVFLSATKSFVKLQDSFSMKEILKGSQTGLGLSCDCNAINK